MLQGFYLESSNRGGADNKREIIQSHTASQQIDVIAFIDEKKNLKLLFNA